MIGDATRYAPGGDLYATLATRYGVEVADKAAIAARVNDDGSALRAVLSDAARDNKPSDFDQRGTGQVFFENLTSDPLAAPLESVNNQIGNAVWNVVKNPFVLLAVVLLVAWQFGLLKRR